MKTLGIYLLMAPLIFFNASIVIADTTLEYRLRQGGAAVEDKQIVVVHGGRVLIKAAGGDQNLDILYKQADERMFLIDHRKRSITPIDERQVEKIQRRANDLQPLIHGLAKQMENLSPEQRKKWEEMLGGNISLDTLAESAAPAKSAPSIKVVSAGIVKSGSGVECERMTASQGKNAEAEFCVAAPDALKISELDYQALSSLVGFSKKMAIKAQGLAVQFGINVPIANLPNLNGIPIEVRDLSKRNQGSIRLTQIVTHTIEDAIMKLPQGYETKSLNFPH